jgi:hypothetical protein
MRSWRANADRNAMVARGEEEAISMRSSSPCQSLLRYRPRAIGVMRPSVSSVLNCRLLMCSSGLGESERVRHCAEQVRVGVGHYHRPLSVRHVHERSQRLYGTCRATRATLDSQGDGLLADVISLPSTRRAHQVRLNLLRTGANEGFGLNTD